MKQLLILTACLLSGIAAFAKRHFWGMSTTNAVGAGALFRTDSAGKNYTDVYTFNTPADGLDPYGSLTETGDGNLYGLTSRGGTYGWGTLFQFNPATGVYTKKHDFDSVNGKTAYGSLLLASDGRLYGMTYSGGSMKRGILFRFDPATGLFARLFDFDMWAGAHPYGSLAEGKGGILYGLSSAGGGDATGALFQYELATGITRLRYSFILGAFNSGYDAHGSLLYAADGNLYGCSRFGKPGFESGGGVLFQFNPDIPDGFSPLHYFDEELPGALGGFELMGSLVQASDGKLYGMTQKGGADGAGTLFEYDLTTGTFAKRYDFTRAVEGYRPSGSLLAASDGKLYGLLTSDSAQAKLFRFDTRTYTLTITANVTGTPYYTTLIETGMATSGIIQNKLNAVMQIFPNPAGDRINILAPSGSRIDELLVMDITGKVVGTQTGDSRTMNIAGLQCGAYILAIKAGGQHVYRQFTK